MEYLDFSALAYTVGEAKIVWLWTLHFGALRVADVRVLRGLTFELSRARRRDGLPVWPMMCHGGHAGKTACRSASALERGVRRHFPRLAVSDQLPTQDSQWKSLANV